MSAEPMGFVRTRNQISENAKNATGTVMTGGSRTGNLEYSAAERGSFEGHLTGGEAGLIRAMNIVQPLFHTYW